MGVALVKNETLLEMKLQNWLQSFLLRIKSALTQQQLLTAIVNSEGW